MEDKICEIINHYNLDLNNVYRLKGALILDTLQGTKLLRQTDATEQHLRFENSVKLHAKRNGFSNIDCYISNKEENLLTPDFYGEGNYIKDWFIGEDCNQNDLVHCCLAMKGLARLHDCLRGYNTSDCKGVIFQPDLYNVLRKRIRELKRIRSYIREKKQRNEFEVLFMSYFDDFFADACKAERLLSFLPYNELMSSAVSSGTLCHGSFNYHNFLILPSDKAALADYAIVNFQKCYIGCQLTDLYQFTRKTMEKNNWEPQFCKALIDEYSKNKPISELEYRLLYVLLLFPEKFWKVTNFYYNNRKSWLSEKTLQKLSDIYSQQENKHFLLSSVFKP